MELIYYTEAAALLGVKLDTLKHAVSRGELTKAAHHGRNVCLIKEQVMLFKGRRLSHDTLKPADKALWHSYAKEAVHDQLANYETPSIEDVKRIAHQTAQDAYSQQFISMIEAVRSLIEGGVPQGTFFREHPILANITYALLIAASLASAMLLFKALEQRERQEVLAYLGMLDATLKLQEHMKEPPISIEEIRQRRERIAVFKQQAESIAA